MPLTQERPTANAINAIQFTFQAKAAFGATGGANLRVLSNSWGGGDFFRARPDSPVSALTPRRLCSFPGCGLHRLRSLAPNRCEFAFDAALRLHEQFGIPRSFAQ